MKAAFAPLFLSLAVSCAAAPLGSNLVTNGGFEAGLRGWRPLWTRQAEAGSVVLEEQFTHTGTNSARIEHHGREKLGFILARILQGGEEGGLS